MARDIFVKLLYNTVTALNGLVHKLGLDDRSIDRMWIKRSFRKILKRQPGANKTLNDITTQMMLSDDVMDPVRQFISDKELVKIYARGVLGRDVCPKTLAVLRKPSEVDGFEFPDRCVIKSTHGSGGVILRKNGEPVDIKRVKSWFDVDYYSVRRESNYKHLRRKVIIEEMIFDGADIFDLQVFHQFGRPALIFYKKIHSKIGTEKSTHAIISPDWNGYAVGMADEWPKGTPPVKPEILPTLLELGAKLSQDLSIVRVDWMISGSDFYLGELTNCSAGGSRVFSTLEAEIEFSEGFEPYSSDP
jgi:hypothetical protein